MPIHLTRDDLRSRLVLRAEGDVTFDDWSQTVQRQLTEGCWHYAVLYDARAQNNVTSTAEVKRMIEHVQRLAGLHGPRGPVALVATDLAEYGMGRMHEILTNQTIAFRAFTDVGAAEEWFQEQSRAETA